MIMFIFRTFTIYVILQAMFFGLFYLLYGTPTITNWKFLWENTYNGVPLISIIMVGTCIISFGIGLWLTIEEKAKDFIVLNYVKQLAEPELNVKRNIPRSLRKALAETNELIDAQRKSLQRLANEKAEAHDQVIQERIVAERQRLARELHDSVSQQLFAASMLLSAIAESEEHSDGAKKNLLQVENIVHQAQMEMRALLLHLRPIALKDNTLAEGLIGLMKELEQKINLKIDYQIEEIQLSKAEEDHLFRIAQEALSNTLRHAKATEVELLLIQRDGIAILRIQDNGVGFDLKEDAKAASYGLKNMTERALEIGAKYKIISIPGEGTIVEVQVPLKQRMQQEIVKKDRQDKDQEK
jgi:signal transduction histidine kinase